MSKQHFDDDCPGCRPIIIDAATGKTNAAMTERAIKIWRSGTVAEREAFHRFTCLNARDPEAIAAMQKIQTELQKP